MNGCVKVRKQERNIIALLGDGQQKRKRRWGGEMEPLRE